MSPGADDAVPFPRRVGHAVLRAGDVGLRLLGVRQSQERISADAQRYWAEVGAGQAPSQPDQYHWRGGSVIDDDRFLRLGREHLELFDRLATTVGGRERLGRVLEWGVGGGANAVAFAPRADEFVAVDVLPASPPECARQVAATCSTPVIEQVVRVDDPEAVLTGHRGSCDLFLCTYVIEVMPGQEYVRRLLRIATDLLVPGGLAFLHFRYDGGGVRDRTRRYGYRLNPATMTTFRVERFWTTAQEVGLEPLVMTLVPHNDLDERYAFVLLRRPEN